MKIDGFIWRKKTVDMAKEKIPENMTLDEASDFWDEHSFIDYESCYNGF